MRSLLTADRAELTPDDLASLYGFAARPGEAWVRAVFISSADGSAQGSDDASGSLSTAGDRRIFALQRSLCDLVLVGAGTAKAEGYRPVQPSEVDTDLRRRLGLAPTPTIAVVSRSLALDPRLLEPRPGAHTDWDRDLAATIVVTTDDAEDADIARPGSAIRVVRAGRGGGVDIDRAITSLAEQGFRRILCEGGPSLLAQVVAARRLDDLCLSISPQLVAGSHPRILEGPRLDPAPRLRLAHLLEEDDVLFARYLVDGPS